MSLGRIKLVGAICGALLGIIGSAAHADDCKEPKEGSNDAPMFSPPIAAVVTGSGRLQFYSAPNPHCIMTGVFVIPKDELVAYAMTDDGWWSVMYINPKTGIDVSGWVRSDRLKKTGTMGPQQ